jgi:ABC-type nitrate/sulfonate/bicarbonate transport system substrate-binding protein
MDTREKAAEWRQRHDELVIQFLQAVRDARDGTDTQPAELVAALLDTAVTVGRMP